VVPGISQNADRTAEAERLRDYFLVQLVFAQRLARLTPMGLAQACLRFTNFHRQFGLGRVSGDAAAGGWSRYAHGLEQRASTPEQLDWTVAFFVNASPPTDTRPRFGCFSCDAPGAEGILRIHFDNRDGADGVSPLAPQKSGRRISELRQMFRHVRAQHPDARRVRGSSWLYNTHAYRRLFPPEFAASLVEPDQVRLDGTSSWGQLLDFRGRVKPIVRDQMLANLDGVDIAAPWRVFPLRALEALSEVESFYAFYDG
jgi:hypothetical protein